MTNSSNASGKGTHALIIGGSMAGLWAGRVMTDHFERVTILDRDHFPDGAEYRSGVPEHVILRRPEGARMSIPAEHGV